MDIGVKNAIIGVSFYYELYSKLAEGRMKSGACASDEDKGSTSQKIANKVGSNNNYVSVCIALWFLKMAGGISST